MSLIFYLPIFLIYLLGLLNLFGIRSDLVVTSLIHFAVGLFLFFLIRNLQNKRHRNFFRDHGFFLYVGSLFLLALTLLLGSEIKGSKRWLDLVIFPLQTSELFKIFFIVFLSTILARKLSFHDKKIVFFQTFILTLLPVVFIMLQPDLATSIIIVAIFLILALNSEIPKKYFIYLLIIGIAFMPVGWGLMHDYQKNRIISFIAPQKDYSGTSYNMTQAKITVGSGGFFGEGLSMGKQTQLSFLPEHHTDFAFSSLVEQFGFMGGTILIFLYITFFWILFLRLIRLVKKNDFENRYKFYYILGFSLIMIVQTAVNIGMNLGIVPIAGVTLPFVSYGGSSLITFMIGLALLP